MSKEFKRQDYMRYNKIGKSSRKIAWRRPKGRDSKMRLKMRGYPKTVSIGYKQQSPKHYELVHNIQELDLLKSKKAILAGIGAKKKIEVIKAAKEKGVKFINIKESPK
jgi:large subunit ribosomal protein L32e